MNTVMELVGQIGKGKGAKFASFVYTAKGTGEKAKHVVILGASTRVLYEKDVALLSEAIPDLRGIEREAAEAILASRMESLTVGIGNNSEYVHSAERADTYVYPLGMDGIRVHKETGEVYVNALHESKTVLVPGKEKAPRKSSDLVAAKNRIMKSLPGSRFRQFALGKVLRAALNGEVLEIETGD